MTRTGNAHTKRRVEIRCPACGLNLANAGLRTDFEWLESISIKKWNTRPRESELEVALKVATDALNEIWRLQKGLKHPSDCLDHTTDGDGCDCGKEMIGYLSRHALEILSRDPETVHTRGDALNPKESVQTLSPETEQQQEKKQNKGE